MFSAFARAIAQLEDPAFRRPIGSSLGLAALVFAGLWLAVWLVLSHTTITAWPWVDTALDVLGGLAAIVLTFVLFPGVVAALLSLFAERIIAAVELRHYPTLPPARAQPIGEQVATALRFLGMVVALNLLALPLYLVPVVNALIFYALNGYLLGREYFEMVAPRRLDSGPRRELWRRRRLGFFLAGVAFAFFSTLPLVNLLAPALAAAAMTHLVESYRRALALGPVDARATASATIARRGI
ncbi:MAG TPA: EI24 domain-containing protein [Alphaproteobacteria bacterium]|nr:EI24 domain-containing protein [Alphaproteobacteria bacterium]